MFRQPDAARRRRGGRSSDHVVAPQRPEVVGHRAAGDSPDSPLEEAGFERFVPLQTVPLRGGGAVRGNQMVGPRRVSPCRDRWFESISLQRRVHQTLPATLQTRGVGSPREWVFVHKWLLERKRSYLTEKGLFSRKAVKGDATE